MTQSVASDPQDAIEVRDVRSSDAVELADLINAIIARGGTTALEEPFTPEMLDRAYLTGPDVLSCVVAVDRTTATIAGFQTLGRLPTLPDDVGDIGTFARIDGTQRGIGTALFKATCARARRLGLTAINATIRADNVGGLAFYGKKNFVDHDIVQAVPLGSGSTVDRIIKRFVLG